MKLALICLCSLVLDRFLGNPHRWNPWLEFDGLARRVEAFCYGPPGWGARPRLLSGLFALIVILIPLASMTWILSGVPYLGVVIEIGLLYLALTLGDLRKQAGMLVETLRHGDLPQARQRVASWVSWDTARMDEETISLAAVETVLRGGYKTLAGALFWFLMAGGTGAMVYRLVDILHTRWGHPTPRYGYFGWPTVWLYYVLNWIPIRLTTVSYLLLGDRETAWRCWHRQRAGAPYSQDDIVLATGAGALNLQLGGVVHYFDRPVVRPAWGEGLLPRTQDIERALDLLDRMVVLWIGLLGLGIWLFT